MIAYRFVDARGVQVADNDDDGESSSGSKLASLLELTHANNVLVVVSRGRAHDHEDAAGIRDACNDPLARDPI